jgi:hypothetical protein
MTPQPPQEVPELPPLPGPAGHLAAAERRHHSYCAIFDPVSGPCDCGIVGPAFFTADQMRAYAAQALTQVAADAQRLLAMLRKVLDTREAEARYELSAMTARDNYTDPGPDETLAFEASMAASHAEKEARALVAEFDQAMRQGDSSTQSEAK